MYSMSKYDEVYFVGNNQVINRVRVGSSKTRNRDTFLSSLAALLIALLLLYLYNILWLDLS